jgi:hypothetical protein
MSIISKLTDKQIREIAEMLDASDQTCFINANTGEIIFMMNNEMLSNYGISWEDEENEELNDDSSSWQEEMYTDIKADMAKINSWNFKDTIRIEKPESHEAFKFMENFVDEVIPEGKLKQDFWRALSRSHPFRNFNAIVHNCKYREDWFVFKQNVMEEYVRRELGYGYREEE